MYSNVRACCCVPGSVLIYCCCCSCCRSSSCVGWQNVFPWFTASDLSVSFPFIQTPLFNTPVGGTVAFSASIFLPVIPTIHPRYYGHAQSQGGRQAAATDTPLYTRYIYIYFLVHGTYTTTCDTGGRTPLRFIPPARSTSWCHI